MATGLTDREKFLRRVESLALSALPAEEMPLVASSEHHDGVMVALVPNDPEHLTLDSEGALTADDLHITLCFLGKVQDLSSFDQTKILTETRRVCDAMGQSFSAAPDGVIVMGQNDEGVPATALLIQSDEIVALYEALAAALNYKSSYPSFIPHMTTGYGVPVEDAEGLLGEPITFSNIIVKFGDDKHVIPLASPITAAPRPRSDGANVIDRVIDSLGRLWDEALHPRDGEGKFIKKNGAVSGKFAVPTADRKSVNMVDANRASVIGFHTFGNDVWVLAEVRNPDGSTSQGFARASNVSAVAPVKARLDALYPISDGEDFIGSSLERKRQLDLLLAHITSEYGPNNDNDGAQKFIDSLGLWEKDLDYLNGGDDPNFLGGMRRVDRELDDDELDEQEDIIADARSVKELRERVHGLKEAAEKPWFSYDELDDYLTNMFGADPTEGRKERNPRSGWLVIVGKQRRVFKPDGNGIVEGPAQFDIIEHPETGGPLRPATKIGTEPIKRVYRGMSIEEWEKAQERGVISSDRRGVIADWEGTNAAVDARTAISYLPRNGTGVVVQIDVKDEDEWFTINADQYIRTRSEVPLDRVSLVSPTLTKDDGTLLKPENWENAVAYDPHVQPTQRLLQGDTPDPEVIAALKGGADPFTLSTANLLSAMNESGRFEQRDPVVATGVSPIWWLVDPSDPTGSSVPLAGTKTSSTDRSYFVKESVFGADLGNTDIVKEVLASLISEQVTAAVGEDDDRLLRMPKSVFGDNPEWDGVKPKEGLPGDSVPVHQPAHVISQHANYFVPSGWTTTDAAAEETRLRNDVKGSDIASQDDQIAAFREDMGNLYGQGVAKLVLWDFVTLNGDRNPGNAVLAASPDGSDGMVIPIDHGNAFDDAPVYKEGTYPPGIEGQFQWFMQYPLTRAWLNYVRGGLALNDKVTEATLRRIVQDFADVYGNIDAEQIMASLRSIPGVTDEQVAKAENWIKGVLDRVDFIVKNTEAVLNGITERTR